MADERKERPSLTATLGTWFVAGGAVGYLAGSVLEDILNAASLNPPEDYIKAVPTAIAAIGLSVLGALQYFNRDKHQGMLVINVVDKPEKIKVRPYASLEGFASAVDEIAGQLHNKSAIQIFYSNLAERVQHSPLDGARQSFEKQKHGMLTGMLEVFTPFEYEGRTIDPERTLEDFFETSDILYNMTIEGISDAVGRRIAKRRTSENSRIKWSTKFRKLLGEEIKLAQDVALWAAYLSERNGIVGAKVRGALQQAGITEPTYLPEDVEVVGEKILSVYDQIHSKKENA